jgi:hypothetical protein
MIVFFCAPAVAAAGVEKPEAFELMVCFGRKFSNKLNFLAATSLLLLLRSTLSVAQTCNSEKSFPFFNVECGNKCTNRTAIKLENVYWFSTILMDFYLETKKSATIAGLRLMLFFF